MVVIKFELDGQVRRRTVPDSEKIDLNTLNQWVYELDRNLVLKSLRYSWNDGEDDLVIGSNRELEEAVEFMRAKGTLRFVVSVTGDAPAPAPVSSSSFQQDELSALSRSFLDMDLNMNSSSSILQSKPQAMFANRASLSSNGLGADLFTPAASQAPSMTTQQSSWQTPSVNQQFPWMTPSPPSQFAPPSQFSGYPPAPELKTNFASSVEAIMQGDSRTRNQSIGARPSYEAAMSNVRGRPQTAYPIGPSPPNKKLPSNSVPVKSYSSTIPPANAALPKPALRFVRDITYPDKTEVRPGQRFVKSWRVRNDGPNSWPEGCVLMTAGGDQMTLSNEACKLPTVGSQQEVQIDVELIAPMIEGLYTSYFRAQTSSEQKFGHRLWASVHVNPLCDWESGEVAESVSASSVS